MPKRRNASKRVIQATTPPPPREPWEQRPDEPDAAYARFLCYRNLGPARSLSRAFVMFHDLGDITNGEGDGPASVRASGTWVQDSARYDWPARALAWDVFVLADLSKDLVAALRGAMVTTMTKILGSLMDPAFRPADWSQAVEGLHTIAKMLPPEVLLRAAQLTTPAADPPAPASQAGKNTSGPTPPTPRLACVP